MFENKSCDYCGEPFAKNDDIVVCPDCGAPYHRACWDKHGECAHKAEHAAGYAYTKEATATAPVPEEDFVSEVKAEMAQQKQAQEPTAHAPAAAEGYCENCGAKLVDGNEYCVYCAHKQGDPVTKRNPKYAQVDPLAGMAPEETIAGETVADMALVVRNNSAKVLPKLKKTADRKVKLGWSWPAFLFGYLYLFFRKMYKYGIIVIMAQVLLLNVLNFAMGDPVTKTNQILSQQYNTSIESDNPTQEEYMKVLEATATEMNTSGVTKQIYIMLFGSMLTVHIACALLFEWLYLKHCGDTIKRMKNSAEILGGMSKSEYRLNLLARGGVSIFGVFIGYFAKMAIEQFVAMIMSTFGG
ncbi:MAG: DUF2628 domain-containing protein [Clostridia bacterium]|nr:DUF2628 domain-containing protein [Clostridia bacterium]